MRIEMRIEIRIDVRIEMSYVCMYGYVCIYVSTNAPTSKPLRIHPHMATPPSKTHTPYIDGKTSVIKNFFGKAYLIHAHTRSANTLSTTQKTLTHTKHT